jgi:hypothetical protein
LTFVFDNLDPVTREFMQAEFESDLAGKGLYISARLGPAGVSNYPDLLREAIVSGTADSLADALGEPGAGNINPTEVWAKGVRKMNKDAHHGLAEGEFNRYYIRGLCARVVAAGGGDVEIYRGRDSGWHRPGSDALIGTRLDAALLLNDLRANSLTPDDLSVLPDVNSGLTVRMVL